ncbi:MAG: diguanylate cyclase [Pseudomonadota bacterium]
MPHDYYSNPFVDGPPSVLLIDDQLIVAEAVRRILRVEPDIQLHYCADPARAVAMVNEVRPTVILLDLVMPGVDGITLVRQFRASPLTAMIPIIVLSNKEDPRDKSRAFEAGASDYLVKIPDQIELIARIKAHTRAWFIQQQRDEAFRQLRDLKAQLEQSNETLQRISCQDSLTHLSNRRHFDEFLAKEWMRAIREQSALALIITDIDFFKAYNDNYGHQMGDECLLKVADALRVVFTRPADMVARYGGEEFIVVLPGTTPQGATQVAEALRAKVEALEIPHDFSPVGPFVTVSLGVAGLRPKASWNVERLIRDADQALYEAKRAGRNRLMVASRGEGL